MNKISLKIDTKIFLIIFYLIVWIMPERIMNIIPNNQYLIFLLRAFIVFLIINKHHMFLIKPNKRETLIFIFWFLGLPGMLFVSDADIGEYLWFICDLFNILGIWLYFRDSTEHSSYIFYKVIKAVWLLNLILSFYYAATNIIQSTYGGVIFFLGSKDVTVQSFVCLFGLSCYYDLHNKKRIALTTWLMAFSSLFFAILQGSGQGMVMLGLLITFMMVLQILGNKVLDRFVPIIFIIILAFLYYVILTFSFLKSPFIVDFVQNVLGKEATLTGRDFIFVRSINLFLEHPLIGYGYDNQIVYEVLGKIWTAYNTAHNALLQMLIDYGIIGTTSFITMLWSALSVMHKSRKISIGAIYGAVFVLLIGGLTGVTVPSVYFWLLLFAGITYKEKSEG